MGGKKLGTISGVIVTAALFLGFVGGVLGALHNRHTASTNPCTLDAGQCYSIQGMYSQLHCPGQHERRVEIDQESFFLECFQ